MVYDNGGLVDGCFICGLGGLSARQCLVAMIMICCASHWAGWCLQNAWICVSGLMAVTRSAINGHAMWAVMLMRMAWVRAKPCKRVGTSVCGLLEHGLKPHDVLRHGLACEECAAAVISSYQAIFSFLDV